MTMPLPEPRVHIDIDPAANGRTYGNDLFVCADSRLTLAAVADALDGTLATAPGYADAFAAMKRDA